MTFLKGMLRVAPALAVALLSATSWAQQTDVFAINYFDNASWESSTDGTVRITNPGTTGAPTLADPTAGDLCAMVYVFRPDQQLAECCGCPVSPNGLVTLSVRSDLTNNPLTSDSFPSGVIKIVSSTGTVETSDRGHSRLKCDATAPVPTPSLIAWGTHVQDSGAVTETAFEKAPLGTDELTTLTDKCGDIRDNGSGHGVCSCGVDGEKP
ncbi:MAG TPA: hypothetical protein VMS22_08715 [Candidatus Eisenbacteria bacterium]|nr:hypothetical protein [Candidatus Eisenbacteria bacterium]